MLSHFNNVQLFATPWTVTCQAPLFRGFSRQEYWSGLPFPPPGDLSDPGIEPMSPAWQGVSLPLRHLGIQLLQKETDPRNENIILTYSVLLKWTLSRTRTAIERNRLYKEKKTGNLFYLYFLAIQCGLQDLNFLTPGTELGSWQWKDHVLPTGPPVNSGGFFFFFLCLFFTSFKILFHKK